MYYLPCYSLYICWAFFLQVPCPRALDGYFHLLLRLSIQRSLLQRRLPRPPYLSKPFPPPSHWTLLYPALLRFKKFITILNWISYKFIFNLNSIFILYKRTYRAWSSMYPNIALMWPEYYPTSTVFPYVDAQEIFMGFIKEITAGQTPNQQEESSLYLDRK